MSTPQDIEAAIVALEAQRARLGDALVDAAIAPLRAGLGATAKQVLRQVSVLFLDVVDSTRLGQRLDPEQIHEVMDGALARCTAIVQAHGGAVLQYAGDSLLAAFGVGAVREDDAERAVHAGLALVAESRRQGLAVAKQHGHDGFAFRVGVHTGDVLLGGGVDAEGTIRGLTVHLAARMEQSAPSGGLRISRDTYAHVRGLFEVEEQPPLRVKGHDAPLASYLVMRAWPREFGGARRGVEGIAPPMVGRTAELTRLQTILEGLQGRDEPVVVTIVGDAGLGKSRLLREFEASLAGQDFAILRGDAHGQTRARPYGLLHDIVARCFAITDSDAMDVAKSKLERGLAALYGAEAQANAERDAHQLGHLLGLAFGGSRHLSAFETDAREVRRLGFRAASELLRTAARRKPVLLLLEDLHWADEGSLDFVDGLGSACRGTALLVVALARPDLRERRAAWAQGFVQHELIELDPLGRARSLELASALLAPLGETPEALRELLCGRADGNPFYMEELLKMLIDEGTIDASVRPWTVDATRLLDVRVPQTLAGILQARLDSLDPAEKLALQQASIFGNVFWDRGLAAIDADSAALLPRVASRDLLVVSPSAAIDGTREYRFKHQILQRVTYQTLLREPRRKYHAKAADWIEGLGGERAAEWSGIVAGHLEHAGEIGRAVDRFADAAEHAASRFAHESALGHAEHALAIGADTVPAAVRWRLLGTRERTFAILARRDEQRAVVAEIERLADAIGDDAKRGEAALRRCEIAIRTADWRSAEAAARSALAFARASGDRAIALNAQQRLAIALSYLGRGDEGLRLAHDGLAEAERAGLPEIEIKYCNAIAIIAGEAGDYVANLEYHRRFLALARVLGHAQAIAIGVGNVGILYVAFGDQEQARRHIEEALQLSREQGDRAKIPFLLSNLSEVVRREGDAEQALALAEEADRIAAEVEFPEGRGHAQIMIGEAQLALGRPREARRAFEHSLSIARATLDTDVSAIIAGIAASALAAADMTHALACVEELLGQATDGDLPKDWRGSPVAWACFCVLEALGDPRAPGLLARAHADLLEQASAITDADLRERFLGGVPTHRQVIEAWEARAAPPNQSTTSV